MKTAITCILVGILASVSGTRAAETPGPFTIYIANDNCPDYTWGFDERATRQAYADIVRAHLDLMTVTDPNPPAEQNRYNMAVTNEYLAFVERYPNRQSELDRRIKEGRIFVSPFLCNNLWEFQSQESFLRTLYPARRIERRLGVRFDIAEHMEEPSFPWGAATLLAGSGVRWVSVPFYNYDSRFGELRNPPLFRLQGPDGSHLGVWLDAWASNHFNYTQGSQLLKDAAATAPKWSEHFRSLGPDYPCPFALASGTHGDINPNSGSQAKGYAGAISEFNRNSGEKARLVNAALPQFFGEVDRAERAAPFLKSLRGCFGHTWGLWPVSLAQYAAAMREGDRQYLAAESLLAVASYRNAQIAEQTRSRRQRAEWCWAMLSDHAWNGTDAANRRVNAELRRKWAAELLAASSDLANQAWTALGVTPDLTAITVFNPASFSRPGLLAIQVDKSVDGVSLGGRQLPTQIEQQDDRRVLYAVVPRLPPFGCVGLELTSGAPAAAQEPIASVTAIESPTYRLQLDPKTGGIGGLVHRPTGTELVVPGMRSLGQVVYHDGQDHVMEGVQIESISAGPVLSRVRVRGRCGELSVTTFVTLYQHLDRIDLDTRIVKPSTAKPRRVVHFFPVSNGSSGLRIETTGAILRPFPQPKGDLLPGADPRRFAVQGFVDATTPGGAGLTVVPWDAFAFRLDLETPAFEVLGWDQNPNEVSKDQNGETSFRFRYSLSAHDGGRDSARLIRWSREVLTPLVVYPGRLPPEASAGPGIQVDPDQAIATCLKPADDPREGDLVLRLWKTTSAAQAVSVKLPESIEFSRCDLLERRSTEFAKAQPQATVDVPSQGYGAILLRIHR